MNIKRRKFVLGCSVLTISSLGLSVSGCSSSSSTEEPTVIPDDTEIVLTETQKTELNTNGYLEQDSESRVLLFYDNQYYVFSQVCPHGEGGRIQATPTDGSNKFRCDEHTEQTFDKTGVSNGARTGNVTLSTVIIVS